MRLQAVLLALTAATTIACGQEIVTVQCDPDAHDVDPNRDGGTNPQPDATANRDATTTDPDGGTNPQPDATTPDPDGGIAPDGGSNSCAGSPYCITSLTADKTVANVREAVTLTPVVDNPTAVALTFSAPIGELGSERRTGLPALVLNQLTLTYVVDPNTGVVTFNVTQVPAFFTTTTFVIRLHAKGPGSAPDVAITARVTVRGNTIFSDYNTVRSVASDGRPAQGISLGNGKLIEGSSFIRTPGNMLMARDGTLIVYDMGATPERLRRFELSNENVHLGDFEYQNASSEPYIHQDQSATGLTQLMDGKFALAVYHSSRTPDSAVVIWNEDGSYFNTFDALDPNKRWQSISASQTANEILVVEANSTGRLFRLDPANGNELGTIATDIASAWSVLGVAGGNTYVGISGGIIRVTPQGGKTMISMLMSASFDYWNYLTLYSEGKVIAARDVSSDSENIVVINGTTSEGWLRPAMAGGAVSTPAGLAYLE